MKITELIKKLQEHENSGKSDVTITMPDGLVDYEFVVREDDFIRSNVNLHMVKVINYNN